eukprot:403371383
MLLYLLYQDLDMKIKQRCEAQEIGDETSQPSRLERNEPSIQESYHQQDIQYDAAKILRVSQAQNQDAISLNSMLIDSETSQLLEIYGVALLQTYNSEQA